MSFFFKFCKMKSLNRIGKNIKGTSKISPTYYEIPARYRDCFFLANASLFDSVNWYIHRAYEIIFPELVEKLIRATELDKIQACRRISSLINIMDQCDNSADMRFPVKKENYSFDMIRSFRSTHGGFLGYPITLGGLRISPGITRDEMKAFSILSTHRLAILGLKGCGSFGGIKIDSTGYTHEELKHIVNIYLSKCVERDRRKLMIEPDVNIGNDVVCWIPKEKKDFQSGSDEWAKSTASQGAFFAIRHILENDLVVSNLGFSDKGLSNRTFILQGLGKMGSTLGMYLQCAGATCVGVKEHDCHVYNKDGLNVQEITAYKRTHGTLIGFQLAKPVDNFEIYKENCDILILAAKQKSIVCHMAASIKAKLIVEAAYAAISPSAYLVLRGHSKIVLPDVFVCGGSGVAAYLEYCRTVHDNDIMMVPDLYKNVLHELSLPSMETRLVSGNIVETLKQSGMEQNVLTHAIANIFSIKMQELLDTCNTYNLGYDLKTAAFIMSIKNIFNEIFVTKNTKCKIETNINHY